MRRAGCGEKKDWGRLRRLTGFRLRPEGVVRNVGSTIIGLRLKDLSVRFLREICKFAIIMGERK